jgi:hypothetical protein
LSHSASNLNSQIFQDLTSEESFTVNLPLLNSIKDCSMLETLLEEITKIGQRKTKKTLTKRPNLTSTKLSNWYFWMNTVSLHKTTKLAPKWSGPHRIIRLKGPVNVELLTIKGKHLLIHVNRIKPYLVPTRSDVQFEDEKIQPNDDEKRLKNLQDTQIDQVRKELYTIIASHNHLVEVVELQEQAISTITAKIQDLTAVLHLTILQNPGYTTTEPNQKSTQASPRDRHSYHTASPTSPVSSRLPLR